MSSSARSRSKIQYAAHANVKKMPSATSNTVSVTVTAGSTRLSPAGKSSRRRCRPTRMSCLIPVTSRACSPRSERVCGRS